MKQPLVGVLALQGAFREHIKTLDALGAPTREIRKLEELADIDALVIPGGESTTIGKLLTEFDMLPAVKEKISNGMPVFGTCAGMILLCDQIQDSNQPRIGLLHANVRRNAFGRQVDSFEADLPIPELGEQPFPAVFIRAPLILSTGDDVQTMATVEQGGQILPIAVRQGNILACSFHPELTPDTRFHNYFLEMCR